MWTAVLSLICSRAEGRAIVSSETVDQADWTTALEVKSRGEGSRW